LSLLYRDLRSFLRRRLPAFGVSSSFYNAYMNPSAIRTEELTRIYRKPRKFFSRKQNAEPPLVALDGVNIEVRPGELFGLLGPNGAGKTTLIKILTTLLAPTSGQALVDGHDVVREASIIRPKINIVSGGESCGYGVLTVEENLWLFTQIYGVSNSLARERISRMLKIVELEEKASTKVSHLSTGQRQKMNFCRGFVTDPKFLFLDEPTLGLDVTSARRIRQFIREWVAEVPGRTLLLTTHYMTEADELCDRLAIIDKGKVLVCDTPAALKRQVQRYPLFELNLTPTGNGRPAIEQLAGVHQATFRETETGIELKVSLHEEAAIGSVVQRIIESKARILTLKKVEPTLENVFIELVGHGLDQEESNR
jgi:ABC-2 type transport system ATP-binding protein